MPMLEFSPRTHVEDDRGGGQVTPAYGVTVAPRDRELALQLGDLREAALRDAPESEPEGENVVAGQAVDDLRPFP
jgi:hypothetical protein